MHGVVRQPSTQPQTVEPQLFEPPEDSQVDLRALIGVLRRRWRLIVVTVICVLAVAFLVTLQLQPRYTASTLVVVDTRDSQMLGFETGFADGVSPNSLVDTEVEIARSARVIERTAADLDIGTWAEFAERPPLTEMLKSLVGMGERQPPATYSAALFADLPDIAKVRLVEMLADQITVRRIGLTSIISVSATALDPAAAAKMANSIADSYLTEQIAARVGSNERTAAFLRARVDGLANDISVLETGIDDFVSAKLAELGSPEAKELLVKLNEEEQARRAKARALGDIQASLQANDYTRLAQLMAVQQADLAARRTALTAEMAAISDEARLSEAKRRLDSLDAEIRSAATRQTDILQTEIALSHARSSEARNQITSTLDQFELPKDVSVELFRLQREAETSRALYQTYLTKLRAVEQQTDFNVPDSRVIAAATPPSEPSFPPRRLILAGSILFALGLGIGLAFLREHFIGGVTSVEQLENMSRLSVIASVPRYSGDQASDQPNMAIVAQPLSVFSESIRRIRLGVEAYHPAAKCIFVTSALPGDGKTTIAIALSRHVALTGRSTLLIDADLRHPAVHHLLGEKVERGLIDFLAGGPQDTPDSIKIVKELATGAHFLLGAAASAIATDALLMSSRFDDLMAYARQKFDVVIVDTPPVGLVVDATIVARHCDLGLFIVRYASTSQHAVRSSLRDLTRRFDLPIYGVLNSVEGADGYRYGYSRKYRDYYR